MTQQMQKQLEEKAFQEKIAQIFHNINSIDELITVSLDFELKSFLSMRNKYNALFLIDS